MKRLSLTIFIALVALTVSAVNVTNYPLRTTAQATDWFWLSSVPDKTNYNFPYSSLLSQLQGDITFPTSGIQTNLGSGTNNTLVNVTIIGGTLSNVTGNFSASRLEGYVSLTDIGGVGDGVTDNTLVVSNACAMATNIYVPAGVFLCGSVTTTVPQHWTFAPGSTLLYNTNLYGFYFLMFNGTANTIEGPVWIDANIGTNLNMTTFHSYLTIIGTNNGLYVNPQGNSRITDLQFRGWSGRALTIQGTEPDENKQVNHYFVRNCYFTNNSVAMTLAVAINGAEYGIVMGNKGFWNDCFIEQQCANVEIVGNSCNWSNEGYWLHPFFDPLMGSLGRSHNNVVGNTFNHCGYGYYVQNANTGLNITGNNFLGCIQANAVEGTSGMQLNDNYFELIDTGLWDTSTNYMYAWNIYRNNTFIQGFGQTGTNLWTGFTNSYVWYGNILIGNSYSAVTNNGFIYPTTGINLYTNPATQNWVYSAIVSNALDFIASPPLLATHTSTNVTMSVVGQTTNLMVLVLGGGSNLLQFSSGVLTNTTAYP